MENFAKWLYLKLEHQLSQQEKELAAIKYIQHKKNDFLPKWNINCSHIHCTKNEVFHQEFFQLMWPYRQEIPNLVTFTKETLNAKLHFLCSNTPQKYKL